MSMIPSVQSCTTGPVSYTHLSKLELKDDGTGSISLGDSISLNITYTTEKDKLTITMSYLGQTESDEYTYTLKKGKLTLTDSSQTQITFCLLYTSRGDTAP